MERMREYISRENLLKRLELVEMDNYGFALGVQMGVKHAIQCVKEEPAADVVEVVRCHECTKSTKGGAGYVWCHGWGRNTEMPLDGFCSKGQRKEADHEVSQSNDRRGPFCI